MNDDLKKMMEQLNQVLPQLKDGNFAQMAQHIVEQQKNKMITGTSGGGIVSITINGLPAIESIKLTDEFSSYSTQEQEVLLKAAFSECLTKFQDQLKGILPG